ncbi:MAG: hypothetical protein ACTSRZ_16855 [Promethearchaeota archaeon]
MEENILELFKEFQAKNKEFLDLTISNKDEILVKSEGCDLSKEEINEIIEAWDNHQGALTLRGKRFVLIRTDPLQLAGVSPSTGSAIVGTCIKGKYAISMLEKPSNVNASSVYLQKWIFDKI